MLPREDQRRVEGAGAHPARGDAARRPVQASRGPAARTRAHPGRVRGGQGRGQSRGIWGAEGTRGPLPRGVVPVGGADEGVGDLVQNDAPDRAFVVQVGERAGQAERVATLSSDQDLPGIANDVIA